MKIETIERTLIDGSKRLRSKGVFGAPKDSLSIRIPGQRSFLLQSEDSVPEASPRMLSFDASADEISRVHASIYRVRNDVGAIVVACPPWSRKLLALAPMPAIFDEQVRQLGDSVPKLERDAENAGRDRTELANGGNAYLVSENVVCLGYTLDRVIFNCELLEKCAKSYVLATLSGKPIGTIPPFVRFIAGGRLRKDEKKAARAHLRGEIPTGLGGY